MKELEEELKTADTYTISVIEKYLVLDSFLFVQNIAKTINGDNASEVIAYRDGALSRNNALKEVLQKISKKREYYDKLKQEKKIINNKEETKRKPKL